MAGFHPTAHPTPAPATLGGHPGTGSRASTPRLPTHCAAVRLPWSERVRREVPSMPGVYQLSLDALEAHGGRARRSRNPVDHPFRPARGQGRGGIRECRPGRHHSPGAGPTPSPSSFALPHSRISAAANTPITATAASSRATKSTTMPRSRSSVASAVVHAEAGADIVAPSGMMDGMVRAVRAALDGAGQEGLPILSYAVKYASGFYGPFRDAAGSTPILRRSRQYQMDPGQRARGDPGSPAGRGRGCRHADGQAGAGVPRRARDGAP